MTDILTKGKNARLSGGRYAILRRGVSGGGPPPPSSLILMEDGASGLLLENGTDRILMEA